MAKVFKVLLVVSLASVITSAFIYAYIFYPDAFTDEQCEVVEQNFDKLKVGMTKEEVIPLIGGERINTPILNPGAFPGEQPGEFLSEQKTRWEVWALCSNFKNPYEWFMIAFDTKTNKVVKIFTGSPDRYGFD